jgi:hypothetical protein
LVDGNIHTVEALAHAPKRDLLAIKGISEAKVEKLQQAGRDALSMMNETVNWHSCCAC